MKTNYKVTRQHVIDALVENTLESTDESTFADILENGIKGYKDYPDKELKRMYEDDIVDHHVHFDF